MKKCILAQIQSYEQPLEIYIHIDNADLFIYASKSMYFLQIDANGRVCHHVLPTRVSPPK